MTKPEPLPDLRTLTEGRYEATCGRCLRRSVPVAATSPENAWRDLKAIGWRWFVSEYGGRGYPECPTCAKGPHDVTAAAKAVQRKRKRR